MIPVLIGVSFIIFAMMYFTPGDPAQVILGDMATKRIWSCSVRKMV